jgi:hypothetical protein
MVATALERMFSRSRLWLNHERGTDELVDALGDD